jgi:hypothetical protein
MTTTTKAIRATITLGDIELDVFQLPDGSYRMSKAQTCETVQLDRKRLSELLEKNSLKAIAGKGSTLSALVVKMKVDVGRGNITADLIPLEMATLIWLESGSELGKALAYSCITESLERRADNAFGVIRDEEERNQRFIARKDSILQRHFWTDAIKWYIDNNEVSEGYKRFIYPNVSDCLNKALFGLPAKGIRTVLDMDSSENIRDCVNPSLLPDLTFIEKYAATRVKAGSEPLHAIKEALAFCNYPVRCPKTGLPTE